MEYEHVGFHPVISLSNAYFHVWSSISVSEKSIIHRAIRTYARCLVIIDMVFFQLVEELSIS